MRIEVIEKGEVAAKFAEACAELKKTAEARNDGYAQTTIFLTKEGFEELKNVTEVRYSPWESQFLISKRTFAKKASLDERLKDVTFADVYSVEIYVDLRRDGIVRTANVHCDIIMVYRGEQYYMTPQKALFTFSLWKDTRDYASTEAAWRGLTEPKKVGTLTANKLAEWVMYISKKAEAHDNYKSESDREAARFVEELREAFDGTEGCVCELGERRGRVIKNNLVLTYEVERSGYIRKRVDIYTPVYGNDAVARFKAMTEREA